MSGLLHNLQTLQKFVDDTLENGFYPFSRMLFNDVEIQVKAVPRALPAAFLSTHELEDESSETFVDNKKALKKAVLGQTAFWREYQDNLIALIDALRANDTTAWQRHSGFPILFNTEYNEQRIHAGLDEGDFKASQLAEERQRLFSLLTRRDSPTQPSTSFFIRPELESAAAAAHSISDVANAVTRRLETALSAFNKPQHAAASDTEEEEHMRLAVRAWNLKDVLLPARFRPGGPSGVEFSKLRTSTDHVELDVKALYGLTSQMRLLANDAESKPVVTTPLFCTEHPAVWTPLSPPNLVLFASELFAAKCATVSYAYDAKDDAARASAAAFCLLFGKPPVRTWKYDGDDGAARLQADLMRGLAQRCAVAGATEHMVGTRRYLLAIDADAGRMFRRFRQFGSPDLPSLSAVHNIQAMSANSVTEAEFDAHQNKYASASHHALSAYAPDFQRLRTDADHHVAARIGQHIARSLQLPHTDAEATYNCMHAWLYNAMHGQAWSAQGHWTSGVFRSRVVMQLDMYDMTIERVVRELTAVLCYAPYIHDAALYADIAPTLCHLRTLLDFVSQGGLVLRAPTGQPLACMLQNETVWPDFVRNAPSIELTYG